MISMEEQLNTLGVKSIVSPTARLPRAPSLAPNSK